MALKERIQERLEGHIADTLLGLGLTAIAGITFFADWLLPTSVIQSLGSLLSAQILIGLTLTVVLLAAWVVYLRTRPAPAPPAPQVISTTLNPTRKFLPDLGFWESLDDGLFYCAKCDVTPLHKKEAGWFCVKCKWLYDDPEFVKRKQAERERQLREEDEMVRRFNQGGPNDWMR